jgi:hypothetical protein
VTEQTEQIRTIEMKRKSQRTTPPRFSSDYLLYACKCRRPKGDCRWYALCTLGLSVSRSFAIALAVASAAPACTAIFSDSSDELRDAAPTDSTSRDSTSTDSNNADARPAAPSFGLTAHWALDEGTGDILADSIGSLHGQLMNDSAVSWNPGMNWTSGCIGGGLQFDGVNKTYALIPFDEVLYLRVETIKTIAVWFKAPQAPEASAPILWQEAACSGWNLYLEPTGDLIFYVKTGSDCLNENTYPLTTAGGDNYADDQWHHVVAVVNRIDDSMELFVDGETIGTMAIDDVKLNSAALRLATNYNFEKMLGCTLDDLRVYDRPLSADEISDLYKSAP